MAARVAIHWAGFRTSASWKLARKRSSTKPGSRGENADFSRHEMVRLHQTVGSDHRHYAANRLVACPEPCSPCETLGYAQRESCPRHQVIARRHESRFALSFLLGTPLDAGKNQEVMRLELR